MPYHGGFSDLSIKNKCRSFVDVQLWPINTVFDTQGWLSNFSNENDKLIALHLLNGFLFYGDLQVNAMLQSNFQMLSKSVRRPGDNFEISKSKWTTFISNSIFTVVKGELPNLTDSGFHYMRKARQELRIKEEQIKDNKEAIEFARNNPTINIIFLDDFLGSGDQFISTLKRKSVLDDGSNVSFEDLSTSGSVKCYYLPIISTEYGAKRIKGRYPNVTINPVHYLGDEYSLFSSNSIVIPNSMYTDAIKLVEEYSKKVGLIEDNGGVSDWRGYHKLGLLIAIRDSIPDATLPIFHWNKNGWIPLMERR
jgi:hypothetical protein